MNDHATKIIKSSGRFQRGKMRFDILAFLMIVAAGPSAADGLNIDATSKPSGVLSKTSTEKLWTAYETAGECFNHPTYGEGKGYKLRRIKAADFAKMEWTDPFSPKSPSSGSASLSEGPKPLTSVVLDETYGERNVDVDAASNWFRRALVVLRQGASAEAAEEVKDTLLSWSSADALSSGIHVSWGDRPVDWQVMTLISAILGTVAAASPQFSPDERAIVGPWVNRLAAEVAASHWKDRQDNKAYFAAYITTVWAIMVSDPMALQNAANVVKLAVHDMRPDGSFPIDSQRSGMGLEYASDSLGSLVMIAALIKKNNGSDLFSVSLRCGPSALIE